MSLSRPWARPRAFAPVDTVGAVNGADRRGWRQVLLLLAVILGVVIMHAPLAAPEASAGAGLMSVEPMPATNHDLSAAVEHPAATGPALVTTFASLTNADITVDLHNIAAGSHDSMPMSAVHDLMHLCLAVLAGLAMLALVGFVAFLLGRPARLAAAVLPAPVIVPPRPPPRTAIRLAQLCVLRN